LLELVKLAKVKNRFKFVELNLNNLSVLSIVRLKPFILPLLFDVAISEPNHFVSQFFVDHKSLNPRIPDLNPTVTVLGNAEGTLVFSLEINRT
jgi:hypothetical protein